jgi:hypothetical protein
MTVTTASRIEPRRVRRLDYDAARDQPCRRIGRWSVSGRRLLVATGAAVADIDQLPTLVRGLIDAASDVLVITPTLPGGLQWLVSDTDRARHEADERLGIVLGQMEGIGVSAEGRVGDETPLTAFDDAVADFQPDHILIALRAADDAGWQERGLVDQVRERFQLPVTVFEIAAERHVPGSSS